MPSMYRKGILGTKLGMTRVFLPNGDAMACTLVEAGPCSVVQRKTEQDDGYEAVQIGFGTRREKRITKPLLGHFKRAGVEPHRHLREVRLLEGDKAPEAGTKITCDIFRVGDFVDAIGTMKGRGTSGVIKRHGFSSLNGAHGAHFFHRHAGSVGCRKPQHTVRGTRMSGRMGAVPVTVQNIEVLRVDGEKNLLYLKGAVPGPNRGLVLLRQAKKRPPKQG